MPSLNRRKVAFVLPSFNAGGAERVLITLMNGLDRTRFEPIFIGLQKNGQLRDLIAPDIPVHTIKNYRGFLRSLPSLLLLLRQAQPDIILSTMAHMNFAVLLLKLFLPRHIKIIVREAITPSYMFDTMKRGWLVKILYKWLYPKADKVICPAQIIIDQFRDLVRIDTENFVRLYNPVHIEKIRAAKDLPEREGKSAVRFICVGRLHPQKGFDRLIDSLEARGKDIPFEWTITILGGGPEEENLKAQIQKAGLEKNIFLKGFAKEPWPHIGAADCLLLPSRFEGLPNVVLESLCAGTPVIATKESGGIQEIASLVPENIVTVVKNMEDFVEAMKNVTPTPTRFYRPSLLPKILEPASVLRKLDEILEEKKHHR
ncbi:MAG: glycosyltransferase [Rhodospirillales bacterium]|nr:glycosyltransferase [Alphaproteobacteria bacterium]USO03783.1 MAG: glycosyltransferase [Rhodospirillales bacterium]